MNTRVPLLSVSLLIASIACGGATAPASQDVGSSGGEMGGLPSESTSGGKSTLAQRSGIGGVSPDSGSGGSGTQVIGSGGLFMTIPYASTSAYSRGGQAAFTTFNGFGGSSLGTPSSSGSAGLPTVVSYRDSQVEYVSEDPIKIGEMLEFNYTVTWSDGRQQQFRCATDSNSPNNMTMFNGCNANAAPWFRLAGCSYGEIGDLSISLDDANGAQGQLLDMYGLEVAVVGPAQFVLGPWHDTCCVAAKGTFRLVSDGASGGIVVEGSFTAILMRTKTLC